MKLLYCGQLWQGSTSLQRAQAFARQPDVEVIHLDTTRGNGERDLTLYERLRWKTGWPADTRNENERVIVAAERGKVDVAFVDNSKIISLATLAELRKRGVLPVYYSPDDIVAPHNMKQPLRRTLPEWSIVFTTKAINVAELHDHGVQQAVLVGNAFDNEIHRSLHFIELDSEFEAFDAVFVGAFERQRCRLINHLAKAGIRVVVYGSSSGMIATAWRRALHRDVELRPPAFGVRYRQCVHHGKIALGFLRKINRDVITTRSIEIPAMARAMIAEKTKAHDQHFVDGVEYIGFSCADELVSAVAALLRDDERRRAVAEAGRRRCISSGYSTDHRAQEMLEVIRQCLVR